MKSTIPVKMTALLAMVFLAFSACTKDELITPNASPSNNGLVSSRNVGPDLVYYALRGGLIVDKYSTTNPEATPKGVNITGLQAGETILSIDFRPATNQMYGVGSTSRLYLIDQESGVATMVGTTPFTPALEGGVKAFDFNPMVDRIRLVTGTGQSLRLNPNTGTVAFTDGRINGQAGAQIAGVAYTNSVFGAMATSTELYAIDITSAKLFEINPPNNGTLMENGPLGLSPMGEGGFDISSAASGNVGLGLFRVNNRSTLFTINLDSGQSTILYTYPEGIMYTGIAMPTLQ